MKELIITSSAFKNNQKIPEEYTCSGKGTNPEILIDGVPKEAKSLVLILNDPDAVEGSFDHWLLYNIPPTQTKIIENSSIGLPGLNSAQTLSYVPPCPPPGKPHRYNFKIYALDTMLSLTEGPNKKTIEQSIKGHTLATGTLIGIYER